MDAGFRRHHRSRCSARGNAISVGATAAHLCPDRGHRTALSARVALRGHRLDHHRHRGMLVLAAARPRRRRDADRLQRSNRGNPQPQNVLRARPARAANRDFNGVFHRRPPPRNEGHLRLDLCVLPPVSPRTPRGRPQRNGPARRGVLDRHFRPRGHCRHRHI